MDFAIGPVNSVFNWYFFSNLSNRRTVKSILLVKKLLGLVEMMSGLVVNASFSCKNDFFGTLIHPWLVLYLPCYLYLPLMFWAVIFMINSMQFGGHSHFSNFDQFFDTDLLMSINKQTLIRAGLRAQPPWLGAQSNMTKNLFFKNWVFCECLFFLSLSDCLIAFTCHYIYINILYLISAEGRTRGKNTRSTMFHQLKIWLLRHFVTI